jgi:hypothetical protein
MDSKKLMFVGDGWSNVYQNYHTLRELIPGIMRTHQMIFIEGLDRGLITNLEYEEARLFYNKQWFCIGIAEKM